MLLMLREKGKYASATENRRFVWKMIVWPLILELYQAKRNQICNESDMTVTSTSRGLVSLIQKSILFKDNQGYSIHYRLIPYMRLKADCDYATALHETKIR